MTRNEAIRFHQVAKRRGEKLYRQTRAMRMEIETLLTLKIRPADNTPEALAQVEKIARKYKS